MYGHLLAATHHFHNITINKESTLSKHTDPSLQTNLLIHVLSFPLNIQLVSMAKVYFTLKIALPSQ